MVALQQAFAATIRGEWKEAAGLVKPVTGALARPGVRPTRSTASACSPGSGPSNASSASRNPIRRTMSSRAALELLQRVDDEQFEDQLEELIDRACTEPTGDHASDLDWATRRHRLCRILGHDRALLDLDNPTKAHLRSLWNQSHSLKLPSGASTIEHPRAARRRRRLGPDRTADRGAQRRRKATVGSADAGALLDEFERQLLSDAVMPCAPT